jgi:hypothetical protein
MLQRLLKTGKSFFLIKAKTPIEPLIEQALRIWGSGTYFETVRTQIKTEHVICHY